MNDQTERLPAFLRRRSRSCDQCSVDEASGERTPCDACHGTGRIADGRLELVLHCTWIQDRYVCPRKFWLRYGEMVEGTGPKAALNYGGAVHEALAARYRAESKGLSANPEGNMTLENAQMGLLTEWFDAHPQPSDEWRNAGRAQDLIRAYNEKYATETWEVLAVEEEFEVEVGEIAHVDHTIIGSVSHASIPCYLAGRKDLVVAWHGGLWVVDHKTASDWGSGDSNSHLDEGRRSFQFRGYAWAERARRSQVNGDTAPGAPIPDSASVRDNLPLLGTVGNYLISRKPYAKPPANGRPALPRNQFHRECYAFEPSVLDEWRSQFLETARDVLAMWQRGVWPHYDTGCGHWGRCEFFDYCEEAPERREAMLSSSMFQQKEFEREL